MNAVTGSQSTGPREDKQQQNVRTHLTRGPFDYLLAELCIRITSYSSIQHIYATALVKSVSSNCFLPRIRHSHSET